MTKNFYSHGKLLLTSEYVVLDGALALALPTKKGQALEIHNDPDSGSIQWKSILNDGSVWFETEMALPLTLTNVDEDGVISRLKKILYAAQSLNPNFLASNTGITVKSSLEFPKNWGLGSSSTLIANIAQWACIDPYELLKKTFGGSGYDIACATAKTPITYQLSNDVPTIRSVEFNPGFDDQLFFVHLNRKQNSRESISHYKNISIKEKEQLITSFSQLTLDCIKSQNDISQFEDILKEHEAKLSRILKTPTIKSTLFSDYPKAIKSLGGWGGDFILVIGTLEDISYFKNKDYHTIVPYTTMLL